MRKPKGRFERLIMKVALWGAILLLLFLTVFLAGSTWEVYQKERHARTELDAVLLKQLSLKEREEALSVDLRALKSERGMEAELRERFPVVKDGEEVIVLVEASSGGPKPAEEVGIGFWGKIQHWFSF